MTHVLPSQQDYIKVSDRADAHADLNDASVRNQGTDGKSTIQLIEKFQLQNANLSKEIKALSEQLPRLLEKEKEKSRANKNQHSAQEGPDSEVQRELNSVYQQINQHQKAMKSLQTKYSSSATKDRYKDVENQATVKDKEINKLEAEKKSLEKTLAEKEKAIETLREQIGADSKVPMLQNELKELKKKLIDANGKAGGADSEGDVQVQRLKDEIGKIKETYRLMLDKTGYDPVENKFRPKPAVNSMGKREKSKTPVNKQEKEEPSWEHPFNQANFQKIFNEVAQMRVDNLKPRRAVGDLNAQSEVLKKEHDEVAKKLAEKEKEANILTIKLRELHRIARFHSILPPDEDEAFRPNMKVQSAKLQSISSPTSGKLGAQSATYNAKPKLARLESSNNYAKNSLLYNGYRKDDRGKVLNDGPGEHFSDRELMGNSKPRMIGLKVWHDNRRIVGFQAVYKTKDGKTTDGGQHVRNPQAYKLESFELTDDDYIKEISGFTSKGDINLECLILMSAKGETKKILEPTRESKLFKFDINELEFPSIIYGYLKEENPRHFITKFGVMIASDDIEENLRLDQQQQQESRREGSLSGSGTSKTLIKENRELRREL